MLRRCAKLPRSALNVARPATRAFTKLSLPAASQLNSSSSSNVILELDVKSVGNEIRKRGLTSALSANQGGLDKVSSLLLSPSRSCHPYR